MATVPRAPGAMRRARGPAAGTRPPFSRRGNRGREFAGSRDRAGAAAVQRDDVIDFQPPGPAAPPATVPVAGEDRRPEPRPCAPVRGVEVSPAHPASTGRARRFGFGARESAPAANTSAAATSSRA